MVGNILINFKEYIKFLHLLKIELFKLFTIFVRIVNDNSFKFADVDLHCIKEGILMYLIRIYL